MKLIKKLTNDSGNKERQPLLKLLKRDFIRLLWSIIYAFGILAFSIFIISATTTLFAYLYGTCGSIIGINFTNVTNSDLVFWAMCSMSTGAVFIAFIVYGLMKLLKKWTNLIIDKHVVIKS